MPRRGAAATEYHLLVTRKAEGFGWEVRYDRFANPTRSSSETYPTREEAQRAGTQALHELRDGRVLRSQS